MIEYSTEALTRELAGDAAGAANYRLASQMASHSHFNFSWGNVVKGLGLGLAGAAANFGIDYATDQHENSLYQNSIDEIDANKNKDSSIGINSQIR